jgi:DNA-binding CsgD family transcriptional regulator
MLSQQIHKKRYSVFRRPSPKAKESKATEPEHAGHASHIKTPRTVAAKEKEILRSRAKKAEDALAQAEKKLSVAVLEITERSEVIRSLEVLVKPLLHADDRGTKKIGTTLLEHLHKPMRTYEEWLTLEGFFGKEHHGFIHTLRKKYSALTPTEIRICLLIHLNFSIKEIADILFISAGTVKQHRNHIRKKINLTSHDNLASFLLSL